MQESVHDKSMLKSKFKGLGGALGALGGLPGLGGGGGGGTEIGSEFGKSFPAPSVEDYETGNTIFNLVTILNSRDLLIHP